MTKEKSVRQKQDDQIVMGTTVQADTLRDAATDLYRHIYTAHWNGKVVTGPDPGIRFNSRIFRFVKSYLSFLPWQDQLVYAQAQKYWINANWLAHDLGLLEEYDLPQIATTCADALKMRQCPEGYWEYPNPEWKDRIATVEGNYAAIGMLLTCQRTGAKHLLEGATKWYDYAVDHIGFQMRGNTIAINYFGNVAGGRIPNNAASTIRLFALLAQVATNDRFLDLCRPLVDFMAEVQLNTGELPYATAGVTGRERIHFLCYQYNAFQFLNIWDYYQLTEDEVAWRILERLAGYLPGALTETGASRYECHQEHPEVVYYTAAVAAALSQATIIGLGDYREMADRAFHRVLSQQKPDGSFPYSLRNYNILSDQRSYPRYLSMILTHLLLELHHHQQGKIVTQ